MKRAITDILFPLVVLLLCGGNMAAQRVTGYVYGARSDGSKEAISMAVVYWKDRSLSATTDEHGFFSILLGKNDTKFLIASYIGYKSDTLEVVDLSKEIEFLLAEQDNVLGPALVTGRQEANFISKVAPIRTEVISATGLCKMACCNLAESFENSASVSVGFSDAVTGARQIRLLGLSGIYTQMSDENRPTLRGLLTPFGLGFVPGQWLESIQIAKGPSSVVHGYEAITGQINMEHRKPNSEKPFYANLFLAHSLRTEANVVSSFTLNKKWETVLFGHFSTEPKPHDGNNDSFLDEPLTYQYNLSNRWFYAADNGIRWRTGFRALYETREAGQEDPFSSNKQDTPIYAPIPQIWKSNIKNKGFNLYSKLAIPLKTPGTEKSAVQPNIALMVDYTYHALDSYFGFEDKNYNAVQNSLFVNLMFQLGKGETHRFDFGLSGHYDQIDEELSIQFHPLAYYSGFLYEPPFPELGRKEHSWGAYGEYTYNQQDKFLLVLGSRYDYNSRYGWLFTPRMNVKYDFTENLIFRASGGKGYRAPNLIADNIGVLSTGRRMQFDNDLDMEQAWTYGLSLTSYFPLGFGERSSLSFDYFRSDFVQQVLVDQERDLNYVWFYNLDGPSYSNSFQVDLMLEPIKNFSILATFRVTDARVHLYGVGTVARPLMSKYKGVLNLQYATRMNIWTFDFTAQLNGPSRLPYFAGEPSATSATSAKSASSALLAVPATSVTSASPALLAVPATSASSASSASPATSVPPVGSAQFHAAYSPVFPVFFAQVTRKFRTFDLYLGGENLTNYRQPNPIISAEDTFSRDFNATVVWGPLMGIKVYAGVRMNIYK